MLIPAMLIPQQMHRQQIAAGSTQKNKIQIANTQIIHDAKAFASSWSAAHVASSSQVPNPAQQELGHEEQGTE